MSILELMHDSQNEADKNPEAFFKSHEPVVDPILYHIQLDEYQKRFAQIKIVTITLNEIDVN